MLTSRMPACWIRLRRGSPSAGGGHRRAAPTFGSSRRALPTPTRWLLGAPTAGPQWRLEPASPATIGISFFSQRGEIHS